MGRFDGKLRINGTLEVTESAVISGSIVAGRFCLAGRAEADIVAEDGLELLRGSHLAGSIFTTNLPVADGAVFQGEVWTDPAEHLLKVVEDWKKPREEARSHANSCKQTGTRQSPQPAKSGFLDSVVQAELGPRRRPKILGGLGQDPKPKEH